MEVSNTKSRRVCLRKFILHTTNKDDLTRNIDFLNRYNSTFNENGTEYFYKPSFLTTTHTIRLVSMISVLVFKHTGVISGQDNTLRLHEHDLYTNRDTGPIDKTPYVYCYMQNIYNI